MTEQLILEEALRQRRAVDGDQRTCARGLLVEELRQHFLACAGLTLDEDFVRGAGEPRSLGELELPFGLQRRRIGASGNGLEVPSGDPSRRGAEEEEGVAHLEQIPIAHGGLLAPRGAFRSAASRSSSPRPSATMSRRDSRGARGVTKRRDRPRQSGGHGRRARLRRQASGQMRSPRRGPANGARAAGPDRPRRRAGRGVGRRRAERRHPPSCRARAWSRDPIGLQRRSRIRRRCYPKVGVCDTSHRVSTRVDTAAFPLPLAASGLYAQRRRWHDECSSPSRR